MCRVRLFLKSYRQEFGGASRDRTDDLIVANDALSQLSYSPTFVISFYHRAQSRLLSSSSASTRIKAMAQADPTVENLTLDLLEWLVRQERTYTETMDAWRTSCPKLPVWEDANDRGFVSLEPRHGKIIVTITSAGREFLAQHRPTRA